MKRLLPFLLLIVYSCVAFRPDIRHNVAAHLRPPTSRSRRAQPAPSPPPQERLFFPKDWYWGWAEFDLAPPHNEIDPNLCAANAGNYGGVNAQCNAFARYQLSGTIEIRPIGRTIARRLNFFFDPNFLFGKNVPQTLYTWSWDGIGMEYKWGVGIDLPKRFEFRFTQHPNIQRFGSRDRAAGSGVARAEWSLGTVQHHWHSEVFWDATRRDGLDRALAVSSELWRTGRCAAFQRSYRPRQNGTSTACKIHVSAVARSLFG